MYFSINSRKLNKEVTFSIPDNGSVFVDLNGGEGVLGKQICHHGRLRGYTIKYTGDNQDNFETICRRWFTSFIRHDDGLYEWMED